MWSIIVKLPRRRFLHLSAGAAALPAASRVASALDIQRGRCICSSAMPPGGPLDISARLMAQCSLSDSASHLSSRIGQAPEAMSRPRMVRAAPDGYTLLEVSASNAWNATLYKNLNFNFIRDIAPVASIRRAAGVMEVNPSVPAKTVPEFIAYAKANPGKINMASAGMGSAPHLSASCSR